MSKQVKQKPLVIDFSAKTEMINCKDLLIDDQPRKVSRADYERLKQSIRDNPNMLAIRPIVYEIKNGKKMVFAGRTRFRAWVELDGKKIPAINVTKLSAKEKKHFLLWDNENVGSWIYEELQGWGNLFGINTPDKKETHRFNDTTAEMPIVPKYDEKYRAVLIVVENEMDFVNLCTQLDLGKAKDYKTSRVKQTQVISYDDVMKKINKWKKSK